MDWLEKGIQRSHAVIIAARHFSTRKHLKEQCIEIARRDDAGLQVIEPDEGAIGIDEIRRLYKTTGYRQRGRKGSAVVINEAHTMTLPAQNAFLKLLEEPPGGVKFILLCPDPQSLIITIRSRCQILHWRPKPLAEFEKEFSSVDEAKRTALYYASGGDVIEAQALLDGADNELENVRSLLGKPLGQAVLDTAEMASTREKAYVVVDQLTKLSHAALRNAGTDERKQQWLARLEAGLEAKEQLSAQANAKLVVDKLILEFRT